MGVVLAGTHHLEFSLEGSGLTYERVMPSVLPDHAPDVVDDLLQALHFKDEEQVNIDGRTSQSMTCYSSL